MENASINGKAASTLVDIPDGQRLVAYEVVAKIVRDLHDRMFSDWHTWYYWKGLNNVDKENECQRFTSLAWGSEGEQVILQPTGPQSKFIPLGIGKVEWEHFVTLTGDTLDHSGLTDSEKEQAFSLLARARANLTVDGRISPRVTVFAVFPHQLTQREKEVLQHLAMGKNNPEIARELFISINTVTRHITNIFTKTSTTNRVQAAVYAARRHLV